MADLTAKVIHETNEDIRSGVYAEKMANGETLYEGGLVSLQAGYIDSWADGGDAEVFLGVCIGGDDRANDGVLTGNTSDTPVPEARVAIGLTLMHLDSVAGTPTQAKVGDLVYCSSDNTDDLDLQASGNTNPVGWMSRFRSATDVDVTLFTPGEYLALVTAAS